MICQLPAQYAGPWASLTSYPAYHVRTCEQSLTCVARRCSDSHFLPSNSSDFNLTVVAPGDAGENAFGVCDFRCYNRLNESTLPASELCTLPVRSTLNPKPSRACMPDMKSR